MWATTSTGNVLATDGLFVSIVGFGVLHVHDPPPHGVCHQLDP
jgi:hypothetical protein